MLRKSFVILSALTLLSVPALAGGDGDGITDEVVSFQMPSRNVGCTYIPEGGTPTYQPPGGHAELQCDRIAPSYVRVSLSAVGKAKKYTNVGDASCCSGEVLPYGETWTAGPFTCVSAASGLTCTKGKHGLVMSRKTIKAY